MLALLNDVECELDKSNLVVGDSDSPATENGEKQALGIAASIGKHLGKIDKLAASKAQRLSRLIHYIRIKSKDSHLAKTNVLYLDSLKERSFGVLNGSRISLESEMFGHTRILAEQGESISMVRQRMIDTVNSLSDNSNVLIVSHPFACQIAFNALLGKNHIALCRFWFAKGSMVILEKKTKWEFSKAVNLISESNFSLDDIFDGCLNTFNY